MQKDMKMPTINIIQWQVYFLKNNLKTNSITKKPNNRINKYNITTIIIIQVMEITTIKMNIMIFDNKTCTFL
jgi:hypothetical protein